MAKVFRQGQAIVDEGTFYVERQVDGQLFERLKNGEFTFVMAPRQVGKSSLLRRTARRLEAEGIKVVTIDLQAIGIGTDDNKEVAEPRWYQSFASAMARPLGLDQERKAFFADRAELTPVAAWTAFLRDLLLERMSAPIVLMIDEADRTRMLPFDCNEFFGALRAIRNSRSTDAAWRRLTICLCGVTAPRDLITDPTAIPVDVPAGLLRVPDLSRAELDAFVEGLKGIPGDPNRLLDAVDVWTNGQPAMTQKLCAALLTTADEMRSEQAGSEPDLSEQQFVDRVVQQVFLGEGRRNDALLMDVEHRFPLGGLPDKAIAVLSLYQIVKAKDPPVPVLPEDPIQLRLVLSGLAAACGGSLRFVT